VTLRCTTLEGFRKRPEGSVVVGNGWLYGCVDRGLFGLAAWGAPTVEEFRRLQPCLEVPLAVDAPPHVALVEVRRLGPLGVELYAELMRYGNERRGISGSKVRRQVILAPAGYERALLVGFREVGKPPYEVVFADSDEEAAQMSDHPHAATLLAEIAQLIEGPLRVKVAQSIATGATEIADVARQLSVSSRTLQRRLASEGTSFVEVVREVMVERAKVLLASTDAKLELVARRVGCRSASHFTASFRRVTGETPSVWRARHVSHSR
jgi:AraC-like DNA-binding protein